MTARPMQAVYRREDGIVDFDKSLCIGCKACIAACPYDAIFINPEDHSAEKCNMCAYRLDIGLEQACVTVCPTEAILVGDLNGPPSPVARIIEREAVQVRRRRRRPARASTTKAPTGPRWTRWRPAAPTAACSPGPLRARRARSWLRPGIPAGRRRRRPRCCPTTCRTRRCAKGPATINQVTDPDRILYPLRRSGRRGSGKSERISSDEALDTLAERIRRAISEARQNEIMVHIGRPGEDGYTERVLASRGWTATTRTPTCAPAAGAPATGSGWAFRALLPRQYGPSGHRRAGLAGPGLRSG